MSNEDLYDAVHRQPFQPFRLVLTTGEAFDIRHPDLIMVGRCAAIVGITHDPEKTMFDRSVKIDLLHIVNIQDLPATPPSANGPAA